jgi:hypothetical protein
VTLTVSGCVVSTQFVAGTPTFTITNDQVPTSHVHPSCDAGMADMHGEATHSTARSRSKEPTYAPRPLLTYTFPESAAGTALEIACHTPGHYEAGMRLSITVR